MNRNWNISLVLIFNDSNSFLVKTKKKPDSNLVEVMESEWGKQDECNCMAIACFWKGILSFSFECLLWCSSAVVCTVCIKVSTGLQRFSRGFPYLFPCAGVREHGTLPGLLKPMPVCLYCWYKPTWRWIENSADDSEPTPFQVRSTLLHPINSLFCPHLFLPFPPLSYSWCSLILTLYTVHRCMDSVTGHFQQCPGFTLWCVIFAIAGKHLTSVACTFWQCNQCIGLGH